MLSVAVQAGGLSNRMGMNKALKPFLGEPLIQRVVERLRPVADELFITSNDPAAYAFLRLRQVPDSFPGFGALGGLHTALRASSGAVVAVAACDLPFASAPLIVASAGILQHEDADVVIAESPEGLEPMHAVYRRDACLGPIEAAIAAGQRRVISWFPSVRVRKLMRAELHRYDPDGVAFLNVNTPEEFAEAEDRARRMVDQPAEPGESGALANNSRRARGARHR